MKEKEAREVAGLLDLLDDLATLRQELSKPDREFYVCAQSEKECLYGSMTLPAESGIVFVDGAVKELRKRLIGYGVEPEQS